MLKPTRSFIGLTWLAVLLLAPAAGRACNVPVFRYALERWAADAYELVVFHREPLTTNQQALVAALEKTANDLLANLSVERVNLGGDVPELLQSLWKTQTNAALPWLVVRYPSAKEFEQPVWAGPLEAENVKTLVDSPARREIVRRLSKSDSLVWLLLESGDKVRDGAVARLLETESRKLAASLRLPEADPNDPQMRSDLPLKIAFSTVRVVRDNPAERMLLNMLLRADASLASIKGPMVYGVFGRGRALPPLSGEQLRAEIIGQAAEFVAGACSCEVKSMNPGFDLLIAADWEALLDGHVVKDPPLPPLVGMSAANVLPASSRQALGSTRPSQEAQTSVHFKSGKVRINLFVLLGVVVAGLATATLLLKLKARRNSR